MIELQTVWGLQPGLYLFLGGVGAGTFFVAGLVHLITKAHQRVVSVAMWCSIAFLAVGLGLLITELSAPLRALMMWRSFSHLTSSWMAIGAWLLFAAMICFAAAALVTTKTTSRLLPLAEGVQAAIGKVATAAGMVLGLCVAVYTGILLMKAPGVPFWHTELLPLLFTVSALDTGVAFTAILFAALEPQAHGVSRVLEASTACLIVAESVVLTLFATTMLAGGTPLFETMEPGYAATAAASAQSWLSGQLAVPFWALLVVIGLAIPLALDVVQLARRCEKARVLAIVSGICVLIGGCTLRFITLLAGTHVDIVANSLAALL